MMDARRSVGFDFRRSAHLLVSFSVYSDGRTHSNPRYDWQNLGGRLGEIVEEVNMTSTRLGL